MSAPIQANDKPATQLAQELRGLQAEPILPIEKKLVGWSLGIGLVLLVILSLLSRIL